MLQELPWCYPCLYAWSAMDYLFDRNDIDSSKIRFIGHSEGGMIAFMLASSHRDIAYIVTLAGPGVDGKTILLEQNINAIKEGHQLAGNNRATTGQQPYYRG